MLLAIAAADRCRGCCSSGALFLVLYGVAAAYFSGVMVRLMLVLAPAVCCLAGVAISEVSWGQLSPPQLSHQLVLAAFLACLLCNIPVSTNKLGV